jgi:putative transposase
MSERGVLSPGCECAILRRWTTRCRRQTILLWRAGIAKSLSIGQACKEAGITQQTYYRWRKEYGGLKLEQARRLKELEKENSRLRRLVTDVI